MSRSSSTWPISAPAATAAAWTNEGTSRRVLVVGPTPLAQSTLASVRATLDDGTSVIVAVSSDASPDSIAQAGDLLSDLSFGEERSAPSANNPLLADTRCAAITSDGLALELDRVRPIRADGDVAVLARLGDGAPVVVGRRIGTARVVVAGSASLVDSRWLTAADNARAVATWLGEPDPSAWAARLDDIALVTPTPSPIPVVVSPEGWVDPDLARATPPDQLVRVAGHLNRRMPAVVHDALVDFADGSPDGGALLLRNLPIGEIPSTPPNPTAPTTKDATSELTLLSVARRLGQPVGYLPEHGGKVVQNILPTRSSLDRQVSTSSNVELMFHTEAAFHPHRPRFLLLLCLRGDPAARTTLCAINDLLPAIPLRVRRVLSERRFRTAADESYVGRRPTQLGVPMAVLTGDWDRPNMVFDADLMVGIDEEADDAVRHLAALIDEHHHGVVLEPGDLLVVDNTVAVHGRSPFRARFDGTDRWLQRSFVIGDLAASAGERSDRVITSRFAP